MKLFFILLYSLLAITAGAQSPSTDPTLLLPTSFFTSKGLTLIQANQTLNQYSNKAYLNAPLNMVYDIRYVFDSPEEAKTFLELNMAKVSEGAREYKKNIKLPNATDIHIYRETASIASFNKMMDLPHAQWYIIFIVDKVVIKIFTSGQFTPFVEPYSIALEAAKHVTSSIGKIMDARDYTLSETSLDPKFMAKTKESKVQFSIPPGFENQKLPQQMEEYYDQEFVYPGENLLLRTYIVTPGHSSDTSDYKTFCRLKGGAASSVYLNIFMPSLKNGKMPMVKELSDSAACKKLCNGDFMVEAFSEISKNSVLGKGYKYAYFVAVYKRGHGDCYMVYFANDEDKFRLFPQLMNRAFQFTD